MATEEKSNRQGLKFSQLLIASGPPCHLYLLYKCSRGRGGADHNYRNQDGGDIAAGSREVLWIGMSDTMDNSGQE